MSLKSQDPPRHVVITGASRGLGRAVARAFHARGDRVSLLARDGKDLAVVARELGARCVTAAVDIADSDAVAAALKSFHAAHGSISVLVNNAGIGAYRPFTDDSIADIEKIVAVNLTGLMATTRIVLEDMIEHRSGHLVHIASDLGRRPLANMAVYTATKHAVCGFSQSIAREYRQYGIKSSVILPGIIDTYFNNGTEGAREGKGSLTAEQVADAVLYVTSLPPTVLIDELSIHSLEQDF